MDARLETKKKLCRYFTSRECCKLMIPMKKGKKADDV